MNEKYDQIAETLREYAQRHGLVERAIEGCRRSLLNAEQDGEDVPVRAADMQARLRSMTFCFRHELLSYLYVKTTLAIVDPNDEEDEIGSYTLVTSMDGEAIDDTLEFWGRQ
jgi:hypothetical protein